MKKITISNDPIHLCDIALMRGVIWIVNKITNEEYMASVYFNMRNSLIISVGFERFERLYFCKYGKEWIAYYVERIVEDFT